MFISLLHISVSQFDENAELNRKSTKKYPNFQIILLIFYQINWREAVRKVGTGWILWCYSAFATFRACLLIVDTQGVALGYVLVAPFGA